MADEFPGLARVAMQYKNDQGLTRFRYVTVDNLTVMGGTQVSAYDTVELEKVQRPRIARCATLISGAIAFRKFIIPTNTHAANTPGTVLTVDTEGKTWVVNSVIGEKTVYRA